MSADTPQQHRASSADTKKEAPATNGHHLPVGANGTARAAGRTDDTRKLKSENEHLLSELKAMKEQMQVVQSRENGITKAYLGVCRDLDHALTSGKPAARAIVPLHQVTVARNAHGLSVNNLTSIPKDCAVVASFNPIAGSNIFLDQSSTLEWTPTTNHDAAAIASAAAARLETARTKAASRSPSPRKAGASPSPPRLAQNSSISASAVQRRDDGLAAVKETIADLQGQHPGDAAKYLAALPASLKWRCFLGVSPAQRAAIMLEMSTDERKLALSMLRPGERTIAERFLGIKHSTEAASLASNTTHDGVMYPGGQFRVSLDHSAAFAAAAAALAPAPVPAGPVREKQVHEEGQTHPPSSRPMTGVASPQVLADFVRDSRQVFRSGGTGGLLVEERLFSHNSPPALHLTNAPPSLYTTNASMHAAVAQAISSASPPAGDYPDMYATNASAATVKSVGTSLHNTQNGPQSVPAAEAHAPVDTAPAQPVHGAAQSPSAAEPAARGKTPDDPASFRGMDDDEIEALSKSVSEMQRKIRETCDSNPVARLSFQLESQKNEPSANAGLHKEDGNGDNENYNRGKLSSKQKHALTSLPPKRPIPVPQFRGNGKEDGSHTSLSGWEHILNTVSHRTQITRDMSPRSGLIGLSPIGPSRQNASTPPRRSVVTPRRVSGEGAKRTADRSPPSFPPPASPSTVSAPPAARRSASPVPQRLTVAEKSERWHRYNSPPPARALPKPRIGVGSGRRSHSRDQSPRMWEEQGTELACPDTECAHEARAQSAPPPGLASTHLGAHPGYRDYPSGYRDYNTNYHSSGSAAPLAAHSNANAKDDFESIGRARSSAGSGANGFAKSVGFVEEVVEQDNARRSWEDARRSLDGTADCDMLNKIALENQALESRVSMMLKGKAAGREARKLQAAPSRFARILDALGIKKLSQDVHHKPIVPVRRHSRDGHSPDASRSCNVPDATSNKLLHLPDALNPSALATILNQLHKLDPALSNQAAECLGKSSLPFDAVPIKSINRQTAANQRGEVWMDANWKSVPAARESQTALSPRLIHASCSKMAESDKEVARKAFALLMTHLPEPMARDESPQAHATYPPVQRNPLGLASSRSLWGSGAAVPPAARLALSPFASPRYIVARPAGNDEVVDPRQVQYLVDLLASVDPLLSQQAAGALAARGMLIPAAHEMLKQRTTSEASSVRQATASIAGNFSSSFLEGQSFSGGSWPPVYMDVPNNGLHRDKLMAPPPIPLPPLPSAPQPFKSHVPKLDIAKSASNPQVELLHDLERGGGGQADGVRLESETVQKILSILRATGNGLSSEIEAALLSDRSQPAHVARKGDGEKLNAGDKNDLQVLSTSNISNSLSSDEKAGVRAPPSPSQKSADGLGGQGSSLKGDYEIILEVGSQHGTAQGSVEDDKPRGSLQKKISFSSFESVIESQTPTKTESQNSSPPTKEEKEAASSAGSLSATSPPAVAPPPRLHAEATLSVEHAEAASTEGVGVPQKAKEEPWTSWVRNKSSTASYKPASFLGSTSPPPRAARAGQQTQESVVVSEDDIRKHRESIRKLLASPAGKLVYARTPLGGKKEPQENSSAVKSQYPGARKWGPNFC